MTGCAYDDANGPASDCDDSEYGEPNSVELDDDEFAITSLDSVDVSEC